MDTKTTKWHRASKWLILCLLLVAAVFYWDSLMEILQGIRQTEPAGILLSIVLSMIAYLIEGMTITCMAGVVVPLFSPKNGIQIAYLCEFYRMITLGSGSGFAEIHYLHKNGMETGSAAGLTMIQYMLKRTAVMLLGILGFAVLYGSGKGRAVCRKYGGFMAAGCIVTVGVIAVFVGLAGSEKIAGWACMLLDRLLWKLQVWETRFAKQKQQIPEKKISKSKLSAWEQRFGKWKEQIRLLNQAGKLFFGQRRKILQALSLQMGKMLLFYAIPAGLLYGKCSLSFVESVLLMAVAYMLSGIIPAPSGAGALEFVFLLFFAGFVEKGMAVPAILLFRFATWVLPFAVGGICVLSQRSRCNRSTG